MKLTLTFRDRTIFRLRDGDLEILPPGKPDPKNWELWLNWTNEDKIIQTIKEVRAITSFGLKESKDLVDAAKATGSGPQRIWTYDSPTRGREGEEAP